MDFIRADPALENIERRNRRNADCIRNGCRVSGLLFGSNGSFIFGILASVWCYFFQRNYSGIPQEIGTWPNERVGAYLLSCLTIGIRKWTGIDIERFHIPAILKKIFSLARAFYRRLSFYDNYINSKIKEFFSFCSNFLLQFPFISKIYQLLCDINSFIEFLLRLTFTSWELYCFYHYEWALKSMVKIFGLPRMVLLSGMYFLERILPLTWKFMKELFGVFKDTILRTVVHCFVVLVLAGSLCLFFSTADGLPSNNCRLYFQKFYYILERLFNMILITISK